MSILSGFFKTKRYRKTADGYKLESNWTSGNTVELDDGNTVQNNVGAIKGITTSTSVTEEGYAADATTVAALNNSLDTIKIKTDQFTGVNTDVNGVYQTSLSINSRKVLSARCNVVNAIVIPYYNNGTNLCFVVVNANGYTPYKNLSNVVLAYEYIETI